MTTQVAALGTPTGDLTQVTSDGLIRPWDTWDIPVVPGMSQWDIPGTTLVYHSISPLPTDCLSCIGSLFKNDHLHIYLLVN